MSELENTFTQLRQAFLIDTIEEEGEIESIILCIESVLGFNEKIAAIEEQSIASLTSETVRFYHALVYVQTVWDLYSAVAFDGLTSIFYNSSGQEIDRLRRVLAQESDPLSPHIEQAYSLVAAAYVVPEENWVTSNPGGDPYALIGAEKNAKLAEIEDSVNALHDESNARAFEAYKSAIEMVRQVAS